MGFLCANETQFRVSVYLRRFSRVAKFPAAYMLSANINVIKCVLFAQMKTFSYPSVPSMQTSKSSSFSLDEFSEAIWEEYEIFCPRFSVIDSTTFGFLISNFFHILNSIFPLFTSTFTLDNCLIVTNEAIKNMKILQTKQWKKKHFSFSVVICEMDFFVFFPISLFPSF